MCCIDDADISIRLQALDLSAGMVNSVNLVSLVHRLIQQMRNAPYVTTSDSESRNHTLTVEPAADSDGEDPEQSLRQSKDEPDNPSLLPPEYRISIMKQILNMCSKDTYVNISDFEWYIEILVQLARLVPKSRKDQSIMHNRRQKSSPDIKALDEDISSQIGLELLNVAVRVESVRTEAVRAAASLLHTIMIDATENKSVLSFAAWIVGEHASHLDDAHAVLDSLIHRKADLLPPDVLCAYLQAIPKLLVACVLRKSRAWNAEHQSMCTFLLARIVQFIEPTTKSPGLDIQERAVELAELLKVATQAVTNHGIDNESWPLLLTKALPQLFTGSGLNPVAPSAQRKIPLPSNFDLNLPLNSELKNLLQSVESSSPAELDYVEFEKLYHQQAYRRAEKSGFSLVNGSTDETDSASYQSLERGITHSELFRSRRIQRRIKNKDDPFYIGGDDTSSGTSTPFHEIIKDSNGEVVDVDTIPVIELDLSDKYHPVSMVEPYSNKQPKEFRIAPDENIEADKFSDSQPVSTDDGNEKFGKSKHRRTTNRQQPLLEVDSSRLGGILLEPSMTAERPLGSQAEDADMAKALQDVERLRLEMQRSSERAQIAEGVSPDGIFIKKKKKRKKSRATEGSRNDREDG